MFQTEIGLARLVAVTSSQACILPRLDKETRKGINPVTKARVQKKAYMMIRAQILS